MGNVIAIGMGKGGVGKSTNSAIICDILSDAGYRVLGIDFDPQGNFTMIISQKSLSDFEDKTILDAMKTKDPFSYIFKISDNLHLLPADDFLAMLSPYIHRDYEGEAYTLLAETIAPLKELYDYIIIDLPPNLGDQTLNGLAASDYTVAVFQPEALCFDGLPRYLETCQIVKEDYNPKLEVIGILTSKMDGRVSSHRQYYETAKKNYPNLFFETIIPERSMVKDLAKNGIAKKTSRQIEVFMPYVNFVKELLERVGAKRSN